MISIIIPIYNQSNEITKRISSLKCQSYGFKNIEVIIVDDGSDDDSYIVCKKLEKRYTNIRYIYRKHKGVSAARNAGIKVANGKYIFFLDADDRISKNTIRDCVRLFDSIYEQVDLITYPIETYYKGRKLGPHFRYKYLTKNGVVDLITEPYVGQTTMNIVVKNRFDYNILFDENMSFSEDQKYCCDVLHEKLKMGFCSTAKYIYNRSEESSSGALAGACYIFETSMKMFENMFARYEIVPAAFQGLFVNDIYWKMLDNILFPYHYADKKYKVAISRIKALLRRCDDCVILNHPNFDFFEKFYLLQLKDENSLQVQMARNEIALLSRNDYVLKQHDMEMVLTKLYIERSKVRILGFLKSVFFEFYKGPIELYAIENDKYNLIELRSSSHNYYRSHEPTQEFYAMDYEVDAQVVHTLRFEVHLGETVLPITYYMMPLFPLSLTGNIYQKDDVQITLENQVWKFVFDNAKKNAKKIWLYYDCRGVELDNGLRQFIHDFKMADEVDRYYVYTDSRQLKYIPNGAKKIRFGGYVHKKLLFQAEKVITAYIEEDNILPFSKELYSSYSGKMHFETIYLQHGVLHIDMPWKYSIEKIMADKVVVSSDVDYKLFRQGGYRVEDIWKTRMPRLDSVSERTTKEKRILYAPSWRSYLVTSNNGHDWKLLEKKFYHSNYYMGIKRFLEADLTRETLETNGYILDVKLHPIFMNVDLNICVDRSLIRFVECVNEADYSLFITDFSSYMFDFLYIKTPILSYIPDYDEFKCGMNGYRNVDFMNNVPEYEISRNVYELLNMINNYFETGRGMDYSVDFYESNSCATDEIYKLLVEK